ncbi:unnamed protein product [Microthlaspi erraticum]|uniref:Uncharacterized protein n=1 Tax=Microthlaspi erraticum TaxID=1685480 RepID=A0A6D2K8D4_9BRAS|nr:unnamed protein product [Microthlaspi erraticum]
MIHRFRTKNRSNYHAFGGGSFLISVKRCESAKNTGRSTVLNQRLFLLYACIYRRPQGRYISLKEKVSDLSLEEDDVLKLVSEKSENRVVRNIKASMKCSDREVSKPATESFSFRIPPSENIESQGRSDLPGIDVLVSAAKRKSRLWSQPTVRLMLR